MGGVNSNTSQQSLLSEPGLPVSCPFLVSHVFMAFPSFLTFIKAYLCLGAY